MYNRVYEFLIKNKTLYEKFFRFQAAHSTEHAILELINSISDSFGYVKLTLGIFIEFSKACDTVYHTY